MKKDYEKPVLEIMEFEIEVATQSAAPASVDFGIGDWF